MNDTALGERRFRAVGAISGTSMDGIDVSIVETDGRAFVKPGAGRTYPYAPGLRLKLLAAIEEGERAETDPMTQLEEEVTDAHCDAVSAFLHENHLVPDSVDLVGLHGQTVWHRPEKRFTRQLLDGKRAATRLGIDVVNRFRHADVASGGEGAPFAPLYHVALASTLERPVMVLNLGGVGNVTFIGEGDPIAFDTGPANALIDDWVMKRLGLPFDDAGKVAATGKADAAIVAALMDNPFFDRKPPKSLDRNDFHRRAKIVEPLNAADGAATLAAFTVEATAAALKHAPATPKRWLVTGGGRLNPTLMDLLRARLGVPVEPVEAVGWNGDFLEAQLFGYLAARSVLGLPLSVPTTTGVPHPMTGGELHRAR